MRVVILAGAVIAGLGVVRVDHGDIVLKDVAALRLLLGASVHLLARSNLPEHR